MKGYDNHISIPNLINSCARPGRSARCHAHSGHSTNRLYESLSCLLSSSGLREKRLGPVLADRQGSTIDSALGGLITYDMKSTAAFGTLKSYFSVSLTNLPNGALPWISNEVWFEDDITLSSPSQRGQGMVQFGLSVHGTGSAQVSQSGIRSSLSVGPFIAGPQRVVGADYPANGLVDVSFLSAPIQFTWGVPFDVMMGFVTHADFANPYPPPCPPKHGDVVVGCPAYSVSAVMDFSNTVTLAAINVFDSRGNPVWDFYVDSGAGAPYATIPETSTFLCAGIGLVVLSVGVGRLRSLLPSNTPPR